MKRLLYALRLWVYLTLNDASWLSFRGCIDCYDRRQAIMKVRDND